MDDANNHKQSKYPNLTLQARNMLCNARMPHYGLGATSIVIEGDSIAFVGPNYRYPHTHPLKHHIMLLVEAGLLQETKPNHYWFTEEGKEAAVSFSEEAKQARRP